ncbi:MAG TPA: hypothetical protein VIR63_03500 [Pontiella sp.]
MRRTVKLLISTLLLAICAEAQHPYDTWDEEYSVQALLGVAMFDNLQFKVSDSLSSDEVDISTLPQVGGAWTTRPSGQRIQAGLETSFLIGFRGTDLDYLYLGGGGAKVGLSVRMWMFDLTGGGYLSLFLDPNHRVRLYGGVGPLISYADYISERNYSDSTPNDSTHDSALGIGAYARAGVEFRTHKKGLLGLGVRNIWSRMDFTDLGGASELKGIAFFVTYTAGF